jgi:hypothetical protein
MLLYSVTTLVSSVPSLSVAIGKADPYGDNVSLTPYVSQFFILFRIRFILF